jgi:hypothetical protein
VRANSGVGFAIPIAIVERVAPALINGLSRRTVRDSGALPPFFKLASRFSVKLAPRISARVCQADHSALILHRTMIKRPRI